MLKSVRLVGKAETDTIHPQLAYSSITWWHRGSHFGVTCVYEGSIGTKMNYLDLCVEVVYGHVNHCVTFAIEYLGNR